MVVVAQALFKPGFDPAVIAFSAEHKPLTAPLAPNGHFDPVVIGQSPIPPCFLPVAADCPARQNKRSLRSVLTILLNFNLIVALHDAKRGFCIRGIDFPQAENPQNQHQRYDQLNPAGFDGKQNKIKQTVPDNREGQRID